MPLFMMSHLRNCGKTIFLKTACKLRVVKIGSPIEGEYLQKKTLGRKTKGRVLGKVLGPCVLN